MEKQINEEIEQIDIGTLELPKNQEIMYKLKNEKKHLKKQD